MPAAGHRPAAAGLRSDPTDWPKPGDPSRIATPGHAIRVRPYRASCGSYAFDASRRRELAEAFVGRKPVGDMLVLATERDCLMLKGKSAPTRGAR